MLKPGVLVRFAGYFRLGASSTTIKTGLVVESYPPTVYSHRLYIVQWQDNTKSLEEEKNLTVVSP
jgi:hypothetical protein